MAKTIYAYDTEFLEDGKTIELISIGIVCEDGREYHAVNSDMDVDHIQTNQWLMSNVVPQLPRFEENKTFVCLSRKHVAVKPKWVIANEVREFLLSAGEPELWADYAAYDHVVLAQLWGRMISLPKGIPMFTHDLQQALELVPTFEPPQQEHGQHNALEDARHLMRTLEALDTATQNFRIHLGDEQIE